MRYQPSLTFSPYSELGIKKKNTSQVEKRFLEAFRSVPGANTLIAKKRGSETWIRYEGQLLCKLSSFDTLQDGGKMPLGCVCILPGQMQDCPHPSRERLKQLCLLQGVQVWGAGTDWTLRPAWGTQQSTCVAAS